MCGDVTVNDLSMMRGMIIMHKDELSEQRVSGMFLHNTGPSQPS
jgi:hypothetical protein